MEVGDRLAVGACGSLLAHLGADVTLLEPAQRWNADKWAHRAGAAASKRSIAIDTSDHADRELMVALIGEADVVVTSSDRCAFDILGSAAQHRGAVVCDLTAFGSTGPMSGVPASDALVQAYTGAADTTGRRDGPPLLIGAPVLEMETAAYGAAAVLAALWSGQSDRVGQRVEVAMYDVGVNALLAFLGLPLTGQSVTRDGNRHLALAPWNAYRATDGWVQICAPSDDLWRRLCAVMEAPALVSDLRFATPSLRLKHVDAIDGIVRSWVAPRTVAACVDLLTRQVIPAGHIIDLQDLPMEPNLLHRGMVHRLQDPETGTTVSLPGSPLARGFVPRIPAVDSGRAQSQLSPRPEEVPRTTTRHRAADQPPLAGVRVIEIGMNTVAPLAGRHLAALGADVIKVEPPRGDSNRWNPPLRDDGQSYVFALSNTGKRGIVLDLMRDDDSEVLWDLLATADILIENLKPGSLERLGFGHRAVRERTPRVVYCSINGFGHDSLYPDRPALDTVIQATSGLMGATKDDGVPYKAGISIGDQIGGQLGLVAVLAGLHGRQRTGEGCSIDLTMQDGVAWVTHPVWAPEHRPKSSVDLQGGRWLVNDATGTAPVLTVDEVLAHPQTKERGLLLDVPTADGSRWTAVETPMRFEASTVGVTSAMPNLGHIDPDLNSELAQLRRHRYTNRVS